MQPPANSDTAPTPDGLWRDLDEIGGGRAGGMDSGPRSDPERAADPGALGPPLDRRQFLQVAGASLALSGLGGCGRPPLETNLPYVHAPEHVVPGQPLFYATALPLDGFGRGVLVEADMGRPTKVEGNPQHPASRGGTDIFAQAAVLELWDPDRSQETLQRGNPASWDELLALLDHKRTRLSQGNGAGLAVLTGPVSSPSLGAQLSQMLNDLPGARWYHPHPAAEVLAATEAAFGARLLPRLHLDRAAVVLSLDADPLGPGPDQVAYARDFAAARRPESESGPGQEPAGGDRFLRLYAVEPTPSLTGAMAEHRLPLRWQQVETLARRVADRLGLDVADPPGEIAVPEQWLAALVADLQRHGRRALVVAGERQPEPVHRLACAINAHLGAIGSTVTYLPPASATAEPHAGGLAALAKDLRAGGIELLLVLDANPVYEAPADLRFADAIAKAGDVVHLGAYVDETAALADWHVPAASPLESWGDLRSPDGTATIVQPVIAPLNGGHTAAELLDALLSDNGPRPPYELVRDYWRQRLGAEGFEQAWQQALRRGYVAGTALSAQQVTLQPAWRQGMQRRDAPDLAGAGLDLLFQPDATIRDGRFANNAWLQELPKPFTKLTWDNAALIAPQTAARLGLTDGDLVDMRFQDRRLQAPVWRLPGQAPDTITLPLGYGRRRAGRFGTGIGFDANALRTTVAPSLATGAELGPVGPDAGTLRATAAPLLATGVELPPGSRRVELATTQNHQRMEGGEPLRTATLAQYHATDGELVEQHALPSLYPPWPRGEHEWGMSIDLNACIGCNACTIACQAENNIPSVGKEQVRRGREMHWIRVDRYFSGPPEAPRILFQPVPCMHCEDAPCEVVCPVGATLHDSEGLNLQVYNRCVGTRFCSNNCPYKVRRFNFLQYTGSFARAQRNPQVTVRMRGIMEKCTYCLQRINAARIEAQTTGRELRDGDVITACQGVCPTRAIVFGDLTLEDSEVVQARSSKRSYALLHELNTRPRTTYQVRLSHPNPALAERAPDEGDGGGGAEGQGSGAGAS